MRVSKHGAHAWLVSANRTAAGAIQYLIRGTAGDRNTNLGLTLNLPLHTGAQRTVHRRPSVTVPIDLALHPAVLHVFHLQMSLALLTAYGAVTAAGCGAHPPAGHRRVHTRADGAGVVADGGAVLIDLAAEQTAARRQVEHLPLTAAPRTAVSRRRVCEMRWAGQDRTHHLLTHAVTSSADAFNTGIPFRMKLFVFFI